MGVCVRWTETANRTSLGESLLFALERTVNRIPAGGPASAVAVSPSWLLLLLHGRMGRSELERLSKVERICALVGEERVDGPLCPGQATRPKMLVRSCRPSPFWDNLTGDC